MYIVCWEHHLGRFLQRGNMFLRAFVYVAFVSGVVVAIPMHQQSQVNNAQTEILNGREEFPTLKRIREYTEEHLGNQTEEEKTFVADYLSEWERFRRLEDKSKFSTALTKSDSPGEQAFLKEYVQLYVKSVKDWEAAVAAAPPTTNTVIVHHVPAPQPEQTTEDLVGCIFCAILTLGILSPFCCY